MPDAKLIDAQRTDGNAEDRLMHQDENDSPSQKSDENRIRLDVILPNRTP